MRVVAGGLLRWGSGLALVVVWCKSSLWDQVEALPAVALSVLVVVVVGCGREARTRAPDCVSALRWMMMTTIDDDDDGDDDGDGHDDDDDGDDG